MKELIIYAAIIFVIYAAIILVIFVWAYFVLKKLENENNNATTKKRSH